MFFCSKQKTYKIISELKLLYIVSSIIKKLFLVEKLLMLNKIVGGEQTWEEELH